MEESGENQERPDISLTAGAQDLADWHLGTESHPLTESCYAAARACFFVGLGSGGSSLIPDKTTGSRSGNSATSESCPPIASTWPRRVEIRRSLRFSPIETPSCPIRGYLATSLPRQFARFPNLSTRHFLSSELSCAGLHLLALRGVELLDNVVHVLGYTLLPSLAELIASHSREIFAVRADWVSRKSSRQSHQ